MAVNASETIFIDTMATRLEFEELKLNIDDMFLVINGIITSCEYQYTLIIFLI